MQRGAPSPGTRPERPQWWPMFTGHGEVAYVPAPWVLNNPIPGTARVHQVPRTPPPKNAQKIATTTPLGIEATPFIPSEKLSSDDEIIKYIRSHAETLYHPVGTCKMGAKDDPSSVVDHELNVIGIKGLRVIDASVMPSIIGGNTNAPTIMIAERAADLIKAVHTEKQY